MCKPAHCKKGLKIHHIYRFTDLQIYRFTDTTSLIKSPESDYNLTMAPLFKTVNLGVASIRTDKKNPQVTLSVRRIAIETHWVISLPSNF